MRDVRSDRRSGRETVAAILAERRQFGAQIDEFHRIFYASRQTTGMTYYENIPILKNPLDLWVYQEIIWGLRPTVIVETGTAFGGSALYFARQLDRVGQGQVITIDIEPAESLPSHSRIGYFHGSSVDPVVLADVRRMIMPSDRVMVVLDSDHGLDHVLAELEAYAPLVSPGQFLVVEDTDINGRPVPIDWKGGPGPGHAVDRWRPTAAGQRFQRAVIAERYMITHHTWLRRKADGEAEVGADRDGGEASAGPQGLRGDAEGRAVEGEAQVVVK